MVQGPHSHAVIALADVLQAVVEIVEWSGSTEYLQVNTRTNLD